MSQAGGGVSVLLMQLPLCLLSSQYSDRSSLHTHSSPLVDDHCNRRLRSKRSFVKMNDMSKLETEELLPCLHVHLYHPNQANRPLFHNLPLNEPYVMDAEDPLRLGRDEQACIFVLNDTSVSRKQLSIQPYRKANSASLSFTVQNMSQKVSLMMGGAELKHLERAELNDKALLRFGRYELLIWQEPGDSKSKFEILFETRSTPPSQELGIDVPCRSPVMDTGVTWRSLENAGPMSQEPLESDETVILV